ncbi:MAG: class I SAM-dependent methyltransferase [Deltaproteobacteria bacterium]|jgi:SAM-dependent methyltransferase|nr:class I SAM-dependent methyltransferase [Deltaproteobacteria bacterium]
MKSDQERWDKKYQGEEFAYGKKPNAFLKKHLSSLEKGVALDLASGEGRNAVFLAENGWKVDAVDISPVGVRKARRLAKEAGVKINFRQADLDFYPIAKEKYDLISILYFWDRRLIPRLKRGLKKGGRILFETYTFETLFRGLEGPREAKYLLKANELLDLFRDFRVLFYREGIFREGGRRKAIASLIAEKA